MNQNAEQSHQDRIINQFSRQAIPFTQVPGHNDAMQQLASAVGLSAQDRVLDVACGPGILACEFARTAGHVTGIDLTPAMIEQATVGQWKLGLSNMAWHVGNAVPLPFADESFDVVVTRYSFHHFLNSAAALQEMIRVCRRGGRVLVADVVTTAATVHAYDALETVRDNSHHHALTEEEWESMLKSSGLGHWKQFSYGVEMDLEMILAASFPEPGGAGIVRDLITNDVGVDRLGVRARKQGDRVFYTYPIGVFVGRK